MKARTILGIALALPVTLVTFLFYILPLWALGWYRYAGWFGDGTGKALNDKSPLASSPVWIVQYDRCPGWLQRYWTKWAGHCVGTAIVVRNEPGTSKKADTILIHELHHSDQMHRWGSLQPVLYFASSVCAWVAGEDHYTMNIFEMDARRVAGQIVDAQSFMQGYQAGKATPPAPKQP